MDADRTWRSLQYGDKRLTPLGGVLCDSGPGFIRAQNIRFGRLRLDDLAFVNPPDKSEGKGSG